MDDSYLYVIVALLPLSACMLVFQVNPYHALVIRGILGAVAALVYAVLGAADVALTEALVGTMLAITLYAVAVRSSLIMKLGVLQKTAGETPSSSEDNPFDYLTRELKGILSKRHMRLELVPYSTAQDLQQALMARDIHAACTLRTVERSQPSQSPESIGTEEPDGLPFETITRVQRLYDIMRAELAPSVTRLTYVHAPDPGEKH
jgi:putative multicomponent Na+:H+ antiporter subunit B